MYIYLYKIIYTYFINIHIHLYINIEYVKYIFTYRSFPNEVQRSDQSRQLLCLLDKETINLRSTGRTKKFGLGGVNE